MSTTLHGNIFQINSDIPWEDAAPGITRQVFGYNDSVMLVKVKFVKGAVGSPHQHMHTQVSYVESGLFEMTIGEEKKLVKKGDGFYVPPHLIHGCVCMEAGVLIDVFSPLREDFIKSSTS